MKIDLSKLTDAVKEVASLASQHASVVAERDQLKSDHKASQDAVDTLTASLLAATKSPAEAVGIAAVAAALASPQPAPVAPVVAPVAPAPAPVAPVAPVVAPSPAPVAPVAPVVAPVAPAASPAAPQEKTFLQNMAAEIAAIQHRIVPSK